MSEHDDPCGEAMKPHMDRMLRELVASGPADSEYQRLLSLCREAQELLQEAWDKDLLFRGTRILKWVSGADADEQREGPEDALLKFPGGQARE